MHHGLVQLSSNLRKPAWNLGFTAIKNFLFFFFKVRIVRVFVWLVWWFVCEMVVTYWKSMTWKWLTELCRIVGCSGSGYLLSLCFSSSLFYDWFGANHRQIRWSILFRFILDNGDVIVHIFTRRFYLHLSCISDKGSRVHREKAINPTKWSTKKAKNPTEIGQNLHPPMANLGGFLTKRDACICIYNPNTMNF